MSKRRAPLVTEQIYHIVNRGVASAPVFFDKRDYRSLKNRMVYYKNINPPIRYSYFVNSTIEKQQEIINLIQASNGNLVSIIAYCFMPNHWHLLLKQLVDRGIELYMSKLSNSYARYFNTRHDRNGPIFQGRFKSVLIDDDAQLLHVSRYIHLNPYSSNLVGDSESLKNYDHSSFAEYLSHTEGGICDKTLIMSHYRSAEKYQEFVLDHADYQKKLEDIKHLILE